MFEFFIDNYLLGDGWITDVLFRLSTENRFIFIRELQKVLLAFHQTDGFMDKQYGWPAKYLSNFHIINDPQTCSTIVRLPDPILLGDLPINDQSIIYGAKSASEKNAEVIIGESTMSIYVENYDIDEAMRRMEWLTTSFYRFVFVDTLFREFGIRMNEYPKTIDPFKNGWPSSSLKWNIVNLSSYGKKVFKLVLPLPINHLTWSKKELAKIEPENKGGKKMNMNLATKPVYITDIETYNNRVVKMTFSDGTFTKAVCSENDKFDIDVGITICFLRKMLNSKNGRDEYAKLIRDAHKLMDAKAEAKAEAEKAKKEEKLRKESIAKKKKQKADNKRNARIDELTEAFIKANRLLDKFITGDYNDAE